MDYWVCVVARNAEDSLPRTLDSLFLQTVPPKCVVVVDDGSTDGTVGILDSFKSRQGDRMEVLTLPDRGYDIRRVQHNINMACAAASKREPNTEFFMVSGDDCAYPENYAEVLLKRMANDTRIAIASGRAAGQLDNSLDKFPSGSGRMIRYQFWSEIGNRYPVRAGGETWIVYKALASGLKVRVYEDLRFDHLRPQGSQHKYVDWGASMHNLGYHPLFVIGRLAKNLVNQNFGLEGSLNMVRGYLQGALGSSDFYFGQFEEPLRAFINMEQRKRMTRTIASRLSRN